MSAEKTPLWKQLLGAGVGATIAIVLYGAYTLITPQLQALIPSADSPIYKGETAFKDANDYPYIAGRVARRLRRFAENMGIVSTSQSEEVTRDRPSRRSIAEFARQESAPQAPLATSPSGTFDYPSTHEQTASSAPAAQAVSSSSDSSQWGTFGPWPYGWVRRTRLFSSSSSAPGAVMQEEEQQENTEAAEPASTVESEATQQSSEPAEDEDAVTRFSNDDHPFEAGQVERRIKRLNQGLRPAADEEGGEGEEVQETQDEEPAQIAQQYAPVVPPKAPPLIVGIVSTNGKLPQSGFGLEVLAVVAAGSVIGKRVLEKKKKSAS